jgi:hypothetical protein
MIDYIIEDCDQFSQRDIDEMFNLVAMHKKTGKEHGLRLCEKDNKITLSSHCVGAKCHISPKKFAKVTCPEGTKEIGSFHTHPKIGYLPSPSDIIVMLNEDEKLSCIGTDIYPDEEKEKFHRLIDCHEIKSRELKKLGKELRNTINEDKHKQIIDSIVEVLRKHEYAYDLLKGRCYMEQSNNPKKQIWSEKKKKYIETFI